MSSLPIDGDKLLENYETICTKIEDLDKCACKIIDKQMMTIFLRLIKISFFFFFFEKWVLQIFYFDKKQQQRMYGLPLLIF